MPLDYTAHPHPNSSGYRDARQYGREPGDLSLGRAGLPEGHPVPEDHPEPGAYVAAVQKFHADKARDHMVATYGQPFLDKMHASINALHAMSKRKA